MELIVNERIDNNFEVMQKVKLKDIAEFIRTGKTPPTNQTQYFEGQINWYTPGDFNNGKILRKSKRTLTQIALDDKKAITFPKDTLLITCIGDIGKIGITQEDCSSNQQITGIKPKKSTDVNYLYYWFLANKKVLENTANSAVVPILNNKTLQNIDFKFPVLPTQQKIAEILDTADQLRQYHKQLIQKYDSLTQSLFLEMFGDPVRNEKEWKKMELGEISDMASGSTPSRTNENNFIGNIPWVKTTEVDGKIINDTLEKISEEALKNSSCRLFPKGSIVIAMYGQGKTRGQIGILGIEAATNQACCVLRPSNKMDFQFLYYNLSMLYHDLRSLGRGGNQPNLNLGLLKNYELINPPLSLQTQFAKQVQMIETQKQQAQQALAKSEDLFQSLLQRAFKGELN
ncbi:restriction endonuclease subunit S [Flavobacterium sp. WC2430]|uniref:restriction endonuclease subunit S n=1 Tax=Flavobacterium sp. WC2430 TaxID=3234137 RepID=UPI0034664E9D